MSITFIASAELSNTILQYQLDTARSNIVKKTALTSFTDVTEMDLKLSSRKRQHVIYISAKLAFVQRSK